MKTPRPPHPSNTKKRKFFHKLRRYEQTQSHVYDGSTGAIIMQASPRPKHSFQQPIDMNPTLFQSLSILCIPLGASMTRTRIKLWNRRILELGGIVHPRYRQSCTNVIIVDPKVDIQHVLEFCQIARLPAQVHLHFPEWLIQSIQGMNRLSHDQFCANRMSFLPFPPSSTNVQHSVSNYPQPKRNFWESSSSSSDEVM